MWFDGISFNAYDNIQGTSLQRNKELVIDAYNDSGSTLTNFTVVREDGANSGNVSIIKASADTIDNATSIGVCTHDILSGEVGKVTTHGSAGGDTSAWNAGDVLYLSTSVAGAMTNIEQPILKPVAFVLVADTEANGGAIYVFQRSIVNITAVGQISALVGSTQDVSTTPTELEIFKNTNLLQQNVTIAQTGSSPYTATMFPSSIGASGFYRISFSVTIESTTNAIFSFEVYSNDVATGILSKVDLSNNNIDSGSSSFSVITDVPVTNVDDVKMYVYSDSGTPTFTCEAAVMNVERIGNV
jgi:hypothetical protein